jgi:hypothetical protein
MIIILLFIDCSKMLLTDYNNQENKIRPLYVSLDSECGENAKLATIIEAYVPLKHGKSVLIGCASSNPKQRNLMRVQVSSPALKDRGSLLVNHIIAKCNDGQIEYSGMGDAYKLEEAYNLVCQHENDPINTYHRDVQSGTSFNHFNMRFEIFNGRTDVLYKVPIMDGMLDASNNALFTHISMVGQGFEVFLEHLT